MGEYCEVSFLFLVPDLGATKEPVPIKGTDADQPLKRYLAALTEKKLREFDGIPLMLTKDDHPDAAKCAAIDGDVFTSRIFKSGAVLYVRLADEAKLVSLIRGKGVSLSEVAELRQILKQVCLLDKPYREELEDSTVYHETKKKKKKTATRYRLSHKLHVDADEQLSKKVKRATPFVYMRVRLRRAPCAAAYRRSERVWAFTTHLEQPDYGQQDSVVFKDSTHRITFADEPIGQYRVVSSRIIMQVPFETFSVIPVRWWIELPSSQSFVIRCPTLQSDVSGGPRELGWECFDGERMSKEEYVARPNKNFRIKFSFQALHPGVHSGMVCIRFVDGVSQYLAFEVDVRPLGPRTAVVPDIHESRVQIGNGIGGSPTLFEVTLKEGGELDGEELIFKRYAWEEDSDGAADQAFQNELTKLCELCQQPNITPIKGVVMGCLRKGLLLARAPHGSVSDLIKQGHHISPLMCAHIAYNIAQALELLHGMSITHCALCPSKLLLYHFDPEAMEVHCTVSDFSRAVRTRTKTSQFPDRMQLSQLTHSLHTPPPEERDYFLAPEYFTMACDSLSCSSPSRLQKVDVYSFGMVLYAMLHCTFPKWDEDLDPDAMAGGSRPPINAALAERHPALFSLIKKCWHEDVEERPSFAGQEGIVQKLWGIINNMTMKRRRLSGDSSPVQWDAETPLLLERGSPMVGRSRIIGHQSLPSSPLTGRGEARTSASFQ